MTCKINQCPSKATYKNACLCQKHYFRFRRNGTFETKNMKGVSKKQPFRSVEKVLSDYKISNTCWEWQGTLSRDGYGIACYKATKIRAHRLSYMYNKGQIKEGLLICHHCDNRKCINPLHLYQGTCQDNSNDMVRRGRCRGKSNRQRLVYFTT